MKQIFSGIVGLWLYGKPALEVYRVLDDRIIFFLGSRESKIIVHDLRPEIIAEIKAINSGTQKNLNNFAKIFCYVAKVAIHVSGNSRYIFIKPSAIRNFDLHRHRLLLSVQKNNRVPAYQVMEEHYTSINPRNGNKFAYYILIK